MGLDAPRVADASNTLVPVSRAKVSMRVAPGDDVDKAMDALVAHLETRTPWGAQVSVRRGETGAPSRIDATGPVYDVARSAFRDAWDGVEPVDVGVGGSIPFIASFMAAYPQAAILVTGVEDPDTRAHGADEGLHLAEFARVCLAEGAAAGPARSEPTRRRWSAQKVTAAGRSSTPRPPDRCRKRPRGQF